jgi:hypothetical protein
LIILTYRPSNLIYSTHRMIRNLFGYDVDKVIVTHRDKKKYMKKFKFDVWIDDSPKGVVDANSLGIKTYLITNPMTKYNHHVRNTNGIICVRGIKELKEEF